MCLPYGPRRCACYPTILRLSASVRLAPLPLIIETPPAYAQQNRPPNLSPASASTSETPAFYTDNCFPASTRDLRPAPIRLEAPALPGLDFRHKRPTRCAPARLFCPKRLPTRRSTDVRMIYALHGPINAIHRTFSHSETPGRARRRPESAR